jgi:hypothetical protein
MARWPIPSGVAHTEIPAAVGGVGVSHNYRPLSIWRTSLRRFVAEGLRYAARATAMREGDIGWKDPVIHGPRNTDATFDSKLER